MSEALVRGGPLPVGSIGTRASGWWGAWFFLISEVALFAYLFFTYFYFSVQPSAGWPPGGPPSLAYPIPQVVVALLGCVSATYAERAISRPGGSLFASLGLGLTALFGAGFIALQFLDWFGKPFGFATSTYSSVYYVVSGTHLAHVVAGELMFIMLFVWTLLGYFGPVRHLPITVGVLYWYFVAALWLAVFFVLDLTPYFFR
ncbi:MAG TPA: cytochrome c oxidase subunit 3 [Xanthobacteraceae bacterium]|jgi:heme/copper-type cytochrome/quinol oxidase subunit 3|nr:cytochrome c oxidase subunit 3 [Xanthobacteraceae bacterium]